jgi:cell division protease FtsH
MKTIQKKTKKERDRKKNLILELKDKSKNKENKTKNFTFIYFVLAFIILALLNGYFFSKGEVKTIQYSDFKEFVASGKIANVVIDKETIQGDLTLEDGKKTKFLTVKVEDPELTRDLQKNNIKYTGRSENKILSTILSWVLPLAFMFLIWNLLMRRMGGAPSGILSFGKSRGKIYGEDEIKIPLKTPLG